jgi:hypothetical protein
LILPSLYWRPAASPPTPNPHPPHPPSPPLPDSHRLFQSPPHRHQHVRTSLGARRHSPPPHPTSQTLRKSALRPPPWRGPTSPRSQYVRKPTMQRRGKAASLERGGRGRMRLSRYMPRPLQIAPYPLPPKGLPLLEHQAPRGGPYRGRFSIKVLRGLALPRWGWEGAEAGKCVSETSTALAILRLKRSS